MLRTFVKVETKPIPLGTIIILYMYACMYVCMYVCIVCVYVRIVYMRDLVKGKPIPLGTINCVCMCVLCMC